MDIEAKIGAEAFDCFKVAARQAFERAGADPQSVTFEGVCVAPYLGTVDEPLVSGDAWTLTVSHGDLYYAGIALDVSRASEVMGTA